MAETKNTDYIETLQQMLIDRKEWLDSSEMVKLKDYLQTFHTSFSSLYNIYLKKKLINEDPYKHEAKISELQVPASGAFQENKRLEQLSLRLSDYDNQLDFLVNFYQLGIDSLNLDQIRRIVGIIRYIDWTNFTPDSQSIITKATAEMTNQSKAGVDTLTLSIIGEGLTRLSKMTVAAMVILKDLNTYYRESYKLSVRQKVTQTMSANEANPDNIRKKVNSDMPGTPFYKELIDEIIKEDYSSSGSDLKDSILNILRIPVEKSKVVKPVINYKNILMNGIQAIGIAASPLNEINFKISENQSVLENRKKGFLETIKELIRQITNAEPEEVVYDVEYFDDKKGTMVKEKINFLRLKDEIEKKSKLLGSFIRGSAYNKLSAMTEDQIIGYLERNIKEVQNIYKSLNAIDDFFKESVTREERDKIKGIKPELSTLKNSIIKANQFRHEYSAQKEEEAQMRHLGIDVPTA